jgi:hypothetical protein
MNSYLLKGGGLLKNGGPLSPNEISDDFTLIHEVDNFIAQFQSDSTLSAQHSNSMKFNNKFYDSNPSNPRTTAAVKNGVTARKLL